MAILVSMVICLESYIYIMLLVIICLVFPSLLLFRSVIDVMFFTNAKLMQKERSSCLVPMPFCNMQEKFSSNFSCAIWGRPGNEAIIIEGDQGKRSV